MHDEDEYFYTSYILEELTNYNPWQTRAIVMYLVTEYMDIDEFDDFMKAFKIALDEYEKMIRRIKRYEK